ncbi:MAG: PH domain-containing protein [Steroidobacteraceae bacterium]
MAEEREVWFGSPSQVLNLGTFILMGLFFWLVIPLFIILWKWLVIKTTKYEITTERVRTRRGVFNKETEELELYRVRDYRLEQPFFLRIFSLGNIILQTSDRSHPDMVLRAIPNGERLREELRTHVEACRLAKRVREIDFE